MAMLQSDSSQRERRKRRTAVEIERKYKCGSRGCQKSYGSEGSLNQHMKNKHPKYYKKYLQTLDAHSMAFEVASEVNKASPGAGKEKKRDKKGIQKNNQADLLGNTNENSSLVKKITSGT